MGFLRLGKSKLKIRMHSDITSFQTKQSENKLGLRKKQISTQVSKVKFKPFYPNQTQNREADGRTIKVFYKRMKDLDAQLSKIKFKILNYVSGDGFKETEGLNSIRNRLKHLDTNFAKIIYKPLEFVNFPKMTKNYSQAFHKHAIGMSLSSFQKKLTGVKKIFMKRLTYIPGPGASKSLSSKMNRRIKKIYSALRKMKHYKTIRKVVLNSAFKPGNKVTSKDTLKMRAAFKRIKDMLEDKNYHGNYEALKKILLTTAAKPGNKVTDKEIVKKRFNGGYFPKASKSKKTFMKMLENMKILLHAGTKPGNKVTDKEVILKKFIGEIFKNHYGLNKSNLDFEGFKKILIKFYRNLSAPIYYKASFDLLDKLKRQKVYNQGYSHFKKVLLNSANKPGNKVTDKDPRLFRVNTERDVLHLSLIHI